MIMKYPGQDDTILHNSEVACFGTWTEPKTPLIQFAAKKTVINHHGKTQRHMNFQQKDQSAKLKGKKTNRKWAIVSPTNPNIAILSKVNRTKLPPKEKFLQSARKKAWQWAKRIKLHLIHQKRSKTTKSPRKHRTTYPQRRANIKPPPTNTTFWNAWRVKPDLADTNRIKFRWSLAIPAGQRREKAWPSRTLNKISKLCLFPWGEMWYIGNQVIFKLLISWWSELIVSYAVCS